MELVIKIAVCFLGGVMCTGLFAIFLVIWSRFIDIVYGLFKLDPEVWGDARFLKVVSFLVSIVFALVVFMVLYPPR